MRQVLWCVFAVMGAVACGGSETLPSSGSSVSSTSTGGEGGNATSSSGTGGAGGDVCDAPCPLWSRTFGDTGLENGWEVAIDSTNDSIYLTGQFGQTINLGGDTLVSAGNDDIFLAAFAPDGSHLWSKSLGGTSFDMEGKIAARSTGGFVLAAQVFGNIDFGGGVLSLPPNIQSALGMAAFAFDGSHLWSKLFSTSMVKASDIVVDGSGNILVMGNFSTYPGETVLLDFGGGPLPYQESLDGDLFIVKFDEQGNHLWSKSLVSPLVQVGAGMATALDGTIFITGGFQGTLTFGPDTLDAGTETDGNVDMFAGAFTPEGEALWGVSVGDEFDQFGQRVVVIDESVFVLGTFGGELPFSTQSLTAPGKGDAFIAAFNHEGAFVTARAITGASRQYIWAATSLDQDLLIAVSGADGVSNFDIQFGDGVSIVSPYGMALARLHPDLTLAWAAGIQTPIGHVYGMAAANDVVVTTGIFFQSINFGPGQIKSSGTADGFIAAFTP